MAALDNAQNQSVSKPELISRDDAIKAGQKTYFTGEPCKHGHVAPRRVGANNECTECKRVRDKAYAAARKDAKASYDKRYRAENCSRILVNKEKWREKNPDYNRDYCRTYYSENADKFAKYRDENRGRRNAQKREWTKNNREHIRNYSRNAARRLKSENLNYRISCALRTRLAVAVRSGRGGSAVSDLGCSIADFRRYIEAQFTTGMTWDNWGRKGWHLDHIKPLASFDLSDPCQAAKACHYTNLRPLWAFDNLSKGAKLIAGGCSQNRVG